MSTVPLAQIDRLAHLLAGVRGIARALDPDPVMSQQDRVNLYELTMLLAEQLERVLDEFTHVYVAPCAPAAPERKETQL